jgi:hypothetical protein
VLDLVTIYEPFFSKFVKQDTSAKEGFTQYNYGPSRLYVSDDEEKINLVSQSFQVELSDIVIGSDSVSFETFQIFDFEFVKCGIAHANEQSEGIEQKSDKDFIKELAKSHFAQDDPEYPGGVLIANVLLRKLKMETTLTDLLKQQIQIEEDTKDLESKYKETTDRIKRDKEEDRKAQREHNKRIIDAMLELEKKQDELLQREQEQQRLEEEQEKLMKAAAKRDEL